MGFQDYISESEAASRAGVSSHTLNRFVEAGYLHVEIEPDGLRLYSRTEIDEIFSSHFEPLDDLENQGGPSKNGAENGQTTVAAVESAAPTPQESAPQMEETIVHGAGVDEAPAEEDPRVAAFAAETASEKSGARLEAVPEADNRTGHPSPSENDRVTEPEHADAEARELARLRELLALKDSEVRDLKEQRDWLQTRVERLEEKGDRDQILLLSETQTIRKLITIQEQRRTPVRQFLEWIGLLPPASPTVPLIGSGITSSGTGAQKSHSGPVGHTIEVRKAAND